MEQAVNTESRPLSTLQIGPIGTNPALSARVGSLFWRVSELRANFERIGFPLHFRCTF